MLRVPRERLRRQWLKDPDTGKRRYVERPRSEWQTREAPELRIIAQELWDSVQSMDAYARSGAHLQAIQAAHAQRYFSESMFVRFVPLSVSGSWQGQALTGAAHG